MAYICCFAHFLCNFSAIVFVLFVRRTAVRLLCGRAMFYRSNGINSKVSGGKQDLLLHA